MSLITFLARLILFGSLSRICDLLKTDSLLQQLRYVRYSSESGVCVNVKCVHTEYTGLPVSYSFDVLQNVETIRYASSETRPFARSMEAPQLRCVAFKATPLLGSIASAPTPTSKAETPSSLPLRFMRLFTLLLLRPFTECGILSFAPGVGRLSPTLKQRNKPTSNESFC